MRIVHFYCLIAVLLTGCARTNDDLAPWANCQGLNLKFGMELYEQCIEEQEWQLSEKVQREEFKKTEKYYEDKKGDY